MGITWRPATSTDIELGLSIQPRYRGDALVSAEAAIDSWRNLVRYPASTVSVLESSPIVGSPCVVGFGASVVVSSSFADAVISNPRADLNSRIIASVDSGLPVLATRSEIARANAEGGVDIVVLCGVWRDDILNLEERQQAKTLLAMSFVERHAGFRIRKVFCEAVDEVSREFIESSIVFQAIAEFPEARRTIYVMTRDSARAVPGSLGNVLFNFSKPVLRLRNSDRQMLAVALTGATDTDLATQLGVTFAAVKARWRSTFARIAGAKPGLLSDIGEGQFRGSQKRHRVLAYLRDHPEELRPYDWKTKP